MKRLIIIFAIGLLTQQITQAQGTMTYLSNLSQTSTGSEAIGSNSWIAAQFNTGNSANGYLLDSIQLAIADSSGNPNDFMVMLYSSTIGDAILPGSSLGSLSGSANPSTAAIYAYTPASNLTLSPNSPYFIVVTAGTTIANGAYEWNLSGVNSYNPISGWTVTGGISSSVLNSSNGSTWRSLSGVYPQFAIDAAAVPEPSSSLLLLLGSGVFIYVRRAFRR